MPARFSTHDLPARDQLRAWQGWFETLFDVTPNQEGEVGFRAESRIWTLNGLAISHVITPPLRASRTKALIRRNPTDHWVITIGQRVETGISTSRDSLVAPPGKPFVLSMGGDFVSDRSHDERLQYYLSRDAFGDVAPALDAALGMVIDTPLGWLLADYMVMLERRLPEIAAEDLPRLTAAARAMIAACVAPSPDRLAVASSHITLGRMERVRRVVRQHLRSHGLTPERLCREAGMSRSTLYRLLDGEGGVAHYVQRQRLLASRAALADAATAKSVAAVADEFCFADASSFSRAFRREFGVAPRDVRAGRAFASATRDRFGPNVRGLRECLAL